jgi:hypothetical protein
VPWAPQRPARGWQLLPQRAGQRRGISPPTDGKQSYRPPTIDARPRPVHLHTSPGIVQNRWITPGSLQEPRAIERRRAVTSGGFRGIRHGVISPGEPPPFPGLLTRTYASALATS